MRLAAADGVRAFSTAAGISFDRLAPSAAAPDAAVALLGVVGEDFTQTP